MTINKKKKNKYRYLKRLFQVVLGLLFFVFLVILFIRSAWGQNLIVNYTTNYISKKTNTRVNIDKAFLTFKGNLQVDGLFLEDQKGDTLVYSKSLEANLPLWKLINGTALGVDALKWNGVRANILRKDTITGYNFQFLIDALAPPKQKANTKQKDSVKQEILIGSIDLKNAHIVYNDIPLGIESIYKVGHLKTSMKTVDVEKMVFNTNDFLLENTLIKYIQNPISLTSDEDLPLPNLAAENLIFKDATFFYKEKSSGLATHIHLSDCTLKTPKLNLNKSVFAIDDVFLKESSFLVHTKKIDSTSNQNTDFNIELPDLSVKLGNVHIENNSVTYLAGNEKVKKNILNSNALAFQNINLKAKEISYINKTAIIDLQAFNFKESSGFNLEEFSFYGYLSNNELKISQLKFLSEKNRIRGNLKLKYNSINQLLKNPEQVRVHLKLPTVKLNLNSMFYVQPQLQKNVYIKELSKKPINGSVFLEGNLARINLRQSYLNWGNSSKIAMLGTIQNSTNPSQLNLNLSKITVQTIRKDILKFINEDSLGVKLPQKLELTGSYKGGLHHGGANIKLLTSQGKMMVHGFYSNQDAISFDANIKVQDYQFNRLLKNNQIGKATVNIKTKGKGKSLNDLDATLTTNVEKLELKDYSIENLNLNGTFKDGVGRLQSDYKDKNINVKLNAFVDLDTIKTTAKTSINIVGADLAGLGFMNREIKTGLDLQLNFEGNFKKYTVDSKVKNGVVVYDNQTYLLGNIDVNSFVDKDTTAFSLKNKMIDLKLESNTNPQQFVSALEKHISSYFYRDEVLSDSITKPIQINFKGKIAQTALLEEVFLVNVKDLDTINIAMDFNQKKRFLEAKIIAPHINYNNNEIDSLCFTINTTKDDFNFKLGFKGINANPFKIPETTITGNQKNNELSLNFSGVHKDQLMMNVDAKITGNRKLLKLKVNPSNLILNKHKWQIPNGNEIKLINNNQLKFTDFEIVKDNQSIKITEQLTKNKVKDLSKDHIAISYQNFKIKEIFNYLNPDKEIIRGVMDGDFILEEPFKNTGFMADITLDKLLFLDTNLGKISLKGEAVGNGKYNFEAKLKEGTINLDVLGDYTVVENKALLNVDLAINAFKMKALNTLSLGEIKDGSGVFSGNFGISGTLSEPKYNGEINFSNAKFNITKLNTNFLLVDESIRLNNNGLFLKEFTIRDAKKNKLIVTGDVDTESFLNPEFNLELKANNFRVLNATKEDNPDLYGIATFNADATLTGNLQIPKLATNITIGKGTKINYVLPATYAGVVRRDDVVSFVNRKNPNAILTQTEEQTATIRGFDIFANLKVDNQAEVTVIIDKNTGDNFKVSGDGEVIFNMLPNGRLSLTGDYTVTEGHYELNLYGLVNRKFFLAPGGRISWFGDPFDAKLNVSAIYNIKTSASPLMASQISDEDPSIKNKFKQVLPFQVFLNIDGELLKPKISFDLKMPEDERGAIGGQVYGRVQQVNQQEEELNKQVFSLLVLNRFYPDSGSDGSLGGVSTIARDNLNEAVAGQLNAFSDKILGNSGIALNFDLNSYTDYQDTAVTDRTQLEVTAEKQLFNDRLTVRVGSDVDIAGNDPTGNQTPLIGNVSLEYKLSNDGRYLLKGFRKNEFENVIDGQTIVSGIALIFTQEFNEFKELWKAMFTSKNTVFQEEQKKAKKKLEKRAEKTTKSLKKKKIND